jgi:hypothetical protein
VSAVDPLAAAVAAADADLAALIDGELAQLAADAQALRGLLVEDAVVTARVLPSNGLTDLLEIAGRRVAASLPPTVRPGDALQVRVTGFDGDRILLQIVGTGADASVEMGPPNQPLPVAPGAAPVVPATGPAPMPPPAAGVLTCSGATVAQSGTPPAPPASGPGSSGGGAVTEIPLAVPPARPGVGTAFTSAISRANVTQSQSGETAGAAAVTAAGSVPATASGSAPTAAAPGGVPPRAPVGVPAEPTSIEARLATARAAIAQRTAAVDAGLLRAPATPPGGAPRFVAPPYVEPKSVAQNAESNARGTPGIATAARASALAAYAEPVALLRALRLPVTPSNVSAAALALQHPNRLPDALAALERALPRASDDPNVATLRTLLAFVGRIDPRSPALAAQIAAYVDHVVDGSEPKLATLLAATRAASSATTPSAATPDGPAPGGGTTGSAAPGSTTASAATPGGPSVPGDSASASAGVPRSGEPPPLAAAVAAERGAALNADLKHTLLAVAANPATPESLGPSLAGALTALTAVQVNAAQTLAAHPDGIAFTIPLATQHGTANAHISVKRDAPDGRGSARVDPANFRIAFVLDTAHYGTVAIDLVTVGREVTVDVRTEAASSMRAFRDALGTLTARLESLRYRVASAGASVGTTSTVGIEAPPSRPSDPNATVDRSA